MGETTVKDATAVLPPQQDHRRKEVVGASVNAAEKAEVLRALRQGFPDLKQSNAARRVLIAYARSAAVRDTVLSFLEREAP